MALPSSGAISTDMIRTELKLAANTPVVIPDTVRKLAGKPTGSITIPNDLWGKSDEIIRTLVSKGYVDQYVQGYGYSHTWSLGSLSPNTLNNVFIVSLMYTEEDRGAYYGVKMFFETPMPYSAIRMSTRSGKTSFSVVLTGAANRTQYELELTDNLDPAVESWFSSGGGTFVLEGI